ncbi:MAG TPA: 2-oxo acid dehydrogenase subunit E2 [Pirellulales bacterium]|nr:2-oxo acid dehydrogenase subunit E2 [Pirellulales bacterium]
MASDFKVPNLGENVEEGDIVKVMVKAGDEVAAEQSVMEIETGKAVVELPCPFAGRITKVHVQEGAKVKVGDLLLTVDGAGPSAKGPAAKAKAAEQKNGAETAQLPPKKARPVEKTAPPEPKPLVASEVAEPQVAAPQVAPKQPLAEAEAPAHIPAGKTPPAGPATRRLARELGVDLAVVAGSGPHGRITEDDVKAAVRGTTTPAATRTAALSNLPEGADEKDAWGLVRRQKMSGIRKAIAVNMAASSATIPHVTNFDDADITELERIRKGGLADYVGTEIKLTMMSFVMKACAQALKLHPTINASVDMDAGEIRYKQYVNIGVAVDTPRGLVVPVVRNVDRLSIPHIAQALTEAGEMAREAKFSLDDLKGGTFTISNLGAVGGAYSTPIINPPQVAVLLLGRSRKLPVVIEDRIEPRLMMPLSLSYDHRIVDGATAARFLNEVINYLTVPGRLLLAP